MAKKKRKTREEKIISQLRRELQEARRESAPSTKAPPEKKPQISVKKEKKIAVKPELAVTKPNHCLKKDLTKSLVLAIMAIAFELAIYYILPEGNFKFF